jgi:hypothetical protein
MPKKNQELEIIKTRKRLESLNRDCMDGNIVTVKIRLTLLQGVDRLVYYTLTRT